MYEHENEPASDVMPAHSAAPNAPAGQAARATQAAPVEPAETAPVVEAPTENAAPVVEAAPTENAAPVVEAAPTENAAPVVEAVSEEAARPAGLVRVRMDVAYDGTSFSGWAVQPGQRTVAGELTKALETIFESPEGLTVAGRTDAGVHATGQVCHVDLPADKWQERGGALIKRLARLLPADVRVTRAQEVAPGFDARFSALWRRYEYKVCTTEWGVNPLRRLDILAWPRELDLAALNAAAEGLIGEHDFAAFCRHKDFATTIREITRLDWHCDAQGLLVATIQADAFCQQMVRSLVGAMLAVGEGRRPVQWPASLLNRTERASEVPVAPAHGLTLTAVGYPADGDYAGRAEATRKLRARRD